ncbi:ABC tran domain containing protein, partial [Asbolus verrucosus]
FRRGIEEDDIYEVLPSLKSSKLGDNLEKHSPKNLKDALSPFRLLWTCYGKYYLLWGILQLSVSTVTIIIQPRLVAKFISYFTNHSKITKQEAILYGFLVIALNIVNSTYSHNYSLVMVELGIRIKFAFSSLIYRKILKLNSFHTSKIFTGKIVNLITKDVNNFDSAVFLLNDMWISLTQLTITILVIYYRFGIAIIGGVSFIIFALSVQETKAIRNIFFVKALSLLVGGLTLNVTLYVVILIHTSLGNNFNAEQAFFLVGCFQVLQSTINTSVPLDISQFAELIVSIRRLIEILTITEQTALRKTDSKLRPLIQLDRIDASVKESTIISNTSLKIESGLTVITGKLGSGKSSLLKIILEDYPICKGKLIVEGKLSYAAQKPWLFPSTIKQNIVFGQNFDEKRYQKVLHICDLKMDIDNFEYGDSTIMGDHGINLSKGQEARISLARAVYYDADIYLLDDCLSSLDAQVQDIIFHRCIKNFLTNKIILMVTHNEKHFKESDNVIVMEGGIVKFNGKFNDISNEEIKQISVNEEKVMDEIVFEKIEGEESEGMQEDSNLIKNMKDKTIYHEIKKKGTVDLKVYQKYLRFGGGGCILFLILSVFLLAQISTSYTEKLLTNWIHIQQMKSECKTYNLSNTTQCQYQKTVKRNNEVMILYTVTMIFSTIFVLFRAYTLFNFSSKASNKLHKAAFQAIIHSTMQFFDMHYIGNILNRFSKDMTTVDEYVPFLMYSCLKAAFLVGGVIILVVTVNFYFAIPAIIFSLTVYLARRYYIPTGRSLKRLEAATRSPMIGHFNATLEGLTTIKAYGTQKILQAEFDKYQDINVSAYHMMQCALRAFAYSLDILCNVFIAAVIITFLSFDMGVDVGNVGLAITQSFTLASLIQWGIKQWAELENQMTSVERVLEYTEIDQENRSGLVLENWPSEGTMEFQHVNLSYGNSKNYVLDDINFVINPHSKTGIVGRTGAGKSSLISVLFRLYLNTGRIVIDDVDIKTLSLDFLRSRITVIPQDPFLFSDTIRHNIDPIGHCTDEEIWKVIRMVKMNEVITSLDDIISENGSKFSSGQRQLICLARAIVSKNKIIILDEVAANMDYETDMLINTILEKCFASCTVIIIAHRLHSVLNCQKIMLISKGTVAEFDEPNLLLNNIESIFFKMVEQP